MNSRVNKAYKNIVSFLWQPHHRDEFLDERLAIGFYSNPLSLYIHVNSGYFLVHIQQDRKTLWIEEGYKYENDK